MVEITISGKVNWFCSELITQVRDGERTLSDASAMCARWLTLQGLKPSIVREVEDAKRFIDDIDEEAWADLNRMLAALPVAGE